MSTSSEKPPKYLSPVGRAKWRELVAKLAGKPFERDAMGLLCNSWDVYLAAQGNIAKNGITYTDTNNGRVWNNPAINTSDLAHKQIVKLSKQLGLWEGGDDENNPFEMP
jgi:P27 family predicted phage terminase small subunit